MAHKKFGKRGVVTLVAICTLAMVSAGVGGTNSLRSAGVTYENRGAADGLKSSGRSGQPDVAGGSKTVAEKSTVGAAPTGRRSTVPREVVARRTREGGSSNNSPQPPRCVGATSPVREAPGAHSGVLVDAQDLWDALAREYCATVKSPSVEEFALYWAYNRLMGIILGASKPPVGTALDPARDRDLRQMLWVAHILGIWQANWLWSNGHGRETYGPPEERSPTGPLNLFGSGDIGYKVSAPRLQQQIRLANRGSAVDVLAFNLNSVRGDELLPGTRGAGIYAVPPVVGLGDYFIYCYSLGFQQAVLGLNKPNVKVPNWARIDYTLGAAQDATYRAGDSPFLRHARGRFRAAVDGESGPAAQTRVRQAVAGAQPLDSLAVQAIVPFAAGTAVWNSIANVRSYSERQYHLLLRDGVYLTQWTHTNVLAGLAAYATKDVTLGRQQVRSHALYLAWVSAYFRSIPVGDPSFPRFEFR